MTKFRKISLTILIISISLIFIGCGTINLKTNTNINANGSGNAKFQIAYDDVVYSILNRDIFNQQWAQEKGFEFSKYSKDNMNVEEITYNFNSLKDLREKINSTKVVTMEYSENLGLNKKISNINFKFNKELIDDLIKQNINTSDKEKEQRMYSYIQDVKLSNDIQAPGTVLSSNSTETVDTLTKEWNYKISQIDENTAVTISYSVKNYTIPIIIAISAIIILSGLGYVLSKRKNKRLM